MTLTEYFVMNFYEHKKDRERRRHFANEKRKSSSMDVLKAFKEAEDNVAKRKGRCQKIPL